jgi:hypothetical protein
MWNELREKLKCKDEICVVNKLKDKALKKTIKKTYFKPERPSQWAKNPKLWLSNFDILEVLEQYGRAYPSFHFIGPSPIDFDAKVNGKCVENDLCNFDLSREKEKGFTTVGIIFNLDKHNEDGSHWVSLFIDVATNVAFFFDSADTVIPPEIKTLLDRIPNVTIRHNTVEHQKGNTECGMYSLYFIIHMLMCSHEGTNWGPQGQKERAQASDCGDFFENHFNNKGHIIDDKKVEKYRNIYFI